MCKNGDSLWGSGKAFNLQRKKRRITATVCRQKCCYEGMSIGDGYAIKGNIEEVKGDKKALKRLSIMQGDVEALISKNAL